MLALLVSLFIRLAACAPRQCGRIDAGWPWSNLAIFIEPHSFSYSLLPLGKTDDGLAIVSQSSPYKVRIERAEP